MKLEQSAIPLSLFESPALEPPPAPLHERLRSVEWSYSRRNAFEQCLLKYYFAYYASIQRFAPGEPDKATIRELKERQNRYELTGVIVHDVIAAYFRRAQEGKVLGSQTLIDLALRSLSETLDLSRQGNAESIGARSPNPPGRLVEFFNDPQSAERVYREARERMVKALQNFASHPRFERVRVAGRSSGTDVERMFKLKTMPCRVTGKVDFALRAAGVPAIVDWKSGQQTHSEDDSLQLTAYAIWGAERFGTGPEKIVVYKAFLGTGELIHFKLTPASIEKGKRRILQDVQAMIDIHPYGVEGRRRAFTPCAQKRVCVLCPFLPICSEGKESLHG